MNNQAIEQTITINYGVDPTLTSPNTGTMFLGLSMSTILSILILTTMIILAATFYLRRNRTSARPRRYVYSNTHTSARVTKLTSSSRSLNIFTILALAALVFAFSLSTAHAIPSLTLTTNQANLTITVPEGGGTAETTTTMVTSTANTTGYTLTASLTQTEPGITIALKDGTVTTYQALQSNDTPKTLLTTTEANVVNSPDTTNITLKFTVDGSATPGTKQIKLTYTATDNAPEEPETPQLQTIQSFTQVQCSNLPIYDGSNEDAAIALHDPRGEGQDYQVAKLADGNCWMLNNLKLGSTTSAITLTAQDSNIAASTTFTLPQLYDGMEGEYESLDTPYAYGPVPGDTGTGETNYGYLYNWSAATAGETTTTMPGDGTNDNNAPYSICPAGWRLPTGGIDENWEPLSTNDLANLDVAFGGTGKSAYSGEPAFAKWQHSGPFKGVFAGSWWSGDGGFSRDDFVSGGLWSASTMHNLAARYANLTPDHVWVDGYSFRMNGHAVRCLLD